MGLGHGIGLQPGCRHDLAGGIARRTRERLSALLREMHADIANIRTFDSTQRRGRVGGSVASCRQSPSSSFSAARLRSNPRPLATRLYDLIPRDENRAHDALPRHACVAPQTEPLPMKRIGLSAAFCARSWRQARTWKLLLDDFEAAPQGWNHVGGPEFPGAKGSPNRFDPPRIDSR